MMGNARKKIEEMKNMKEKVVEDANKLENESREKIAQAAETEAKIERGTKEIQSLEVHTFFYHLKVHKYASKGDSRPKCKENDELFSL